MKLDLVRYRPPGILEALLVPRMSSFRPCCHLNYGISDIKLYILDIIVRPVGFEPTIGFPTD